MLDHHRLAASGPFWLYLDPLSHHQLKTQKNVRVGSPLTKLMSDGDICNLVFPGYWLAKANERSFPLCWNPYSLIGTNSGVTKYQKADGSVSISPISIPCLLDLDIEKCPFRHTSSEE